MQLNNQLDRSKSMSYHHYIKTPHGKVQFTIEQIKGCCGVSVISGVYFRDIENINKLYQYFHDEIIFGKKDVRAIDMVGNFNQDLFRGLDIWKINKFILTDRLRPKEKSSIYNFCHFVGAHYGTVTYNPNSGFNVQVFELTRPKDKFVGGNGRYLSQEGGIQTP